VPSLDFFFFVPDLAYRRVLVDGLEKVKKGGFAVIDDASELDGGGNVLEFVGVVRKDATGCNAIAVHIEIIERHCLMVKRMNQSPPNPFVST
jgi:hypothetical protein